MKTDQELFERFQSLTRDIMATASVVQNDHDRLIVDGMIKYEDVIETWRQFLQRFSDHREELDCLFSDVNIRLVEVLNKLKY
ncbi:hypothetical protein b3_0343 [Synechococcus phage B3]|nr:hypothetical protein b3_0343 [Synechococcus phage B3]QGT54947.1 hypothetical protein b23_0337 [Synechococcus phage B23]